VFLLIALLIWVFLRLHPPRPADVRHRLERARRRPRRHKRASLQDHVAYMISGVLASVGGILLAARLGRGDIASGNNLLLDSVAAALIGFAVLGAAKPNAFGTAASARFSSAFFCRAHHDERPLLHAGFRQGRRACRRACVHLCLSSRKRGGRKQRDAGRQRRPLKKGGNSNDET
jgi:simple sugar transport system permease protein